MHCIGAVVLNDYSFDRYKRVVCVIVDIIGGAHRPTKGRAQWCGRLATLHQKSIKPAGVSGHCWWLWISCALVCMSCLPCRVVMSCPWHLHDLQYLTMYQCSVRYKNESIQTYAARFVDVLVTVAMETDYAAYVVSWWHFYKHCDRKRIWSAVKALTLLFISS